MKERNGKGNDSCKVGVYICHCGTNIASKVDVSATAEYASTLPGVKIARDYKYSCSDPGQELIKQDIGKHGLDRIVVAACSPHLHEKTFRTAVAEAGMNPYLFQMVNIREQVAWVHEDGDLATTKARDLIRAAVRRVQLHKPLERRKVEVHPDVMVIGAGIAGIHAALTLADAGKRVYLVEREPTIGGNMAKFDKTFPTLDCAACILTPKMTSVRSHPNITLSTLAEVTEVDGYVGNFKVAVRHKPRYIVEKDCVGCLDCIEACVFKVPKFEDEFNMGLSKRRPVYIPFPQAVPQIVAIDPETCLQLTKGTCKQTCVEACGDREAIDLTQEERVETIDVGTIILSTGVKTFDPGRIPYYGYGTYDNVYTSLEVERLINSAGPTEGEIVLRDGRKPKSVGIVHCVGSRDELTNRHCSAVCCMYSLKLAHLIREKTDAEVTNFYIDMRTPGKSFEEFYNRVAEEGTNFIRGKVADIYPDPDDRERLILQAEDTLLGRIRKVSVDMVVLSVGLEAQADADDVRRIFNITCAAGGFFTERHPKLAPVSTFTEGIFLAGGCQGPKDIPETVAQAGAAAAEALALVDAGCIELEPNTAYLDEDDCSGCKTCVPLCPYTAITFDEEKMKAAINEVLCKGCGVCVAACPTGTIKQNLFENEEILAEIKGVLAHA